MIQPIDFLKQLTASGVSFYAGVPDSLLKGLLTAITQFAGHNHFITANEGAAVGLAAGYHLATGKLPVVYLQNSGLGNCINPLTSLTDKDMYAIPMLLIVGWRGEPGLEDEPQHLVMGKITPTLLHQLHVPFIVLKKGGEDHDWKEALQEAIELCRKDSRPVALLVESGVFPEEEIVNPNAYEMRVEEAIAIIYDKLTADDIVVCTTGKIGRAFYQCNLVQKKVSRYFLNVGSMGHALSIATGLAMQTKNRVVAFDGDGALLMHMGALALPPSIALSNLHYILLNNGAHQSVGSQPTLGFQVDFCTIARGCGFQNPVMITSRESLAADPTLSPGRYFTEIRINTETNQGLPRPAESPKKAKESFMRALGSTPN
jgi:phosphonopyruvate decarboxylase